MKKYIITIGREFGSGGSEITKKLAEKLGIKYYDKDLITMAAQKRGIEEDVVAGAEERMAKPWDFNSVGLPIFQDRLYAIQSEIIRELAAKDESCIFLGRCADYVLKNEPNVLNVYISASEDFRIQRTKQLHDLSTDDATDMVRRTDRTRRAYYQYYTGRKWGRRDTRDLVLNSGKLGIDTCVDILYTMATDYAGQ